MSLPGKPFEIFCGTGGVGKTTLATARALSLARTKKVLLITIDPAKRLKDLLKMDGTDGEVRSIEWNGIKLDAELMSPNQTIKKIAEKYQTPDLASNRIVEILSRPYGGMNEILALIELQMQVASGKYDTIILDTPPGPHFLDFLEGLNKIHAFFDKSFIELFNNLGKNRATAPAWDIMNKIVSSGMKKLLDYLKAVTGADFIDDFILAISTIYQARQGFLDGIKLQEKFKNASDCHWFIVTSVEQGKAVEAAELKEHARHYIHDDQILLLNKCWEKSLQGWNPLSKEENALKASLLEKEHHLKNFLGKQFSSIISFSDIVSDSPEEHLKQLLSQWDHYHV